MNDPDIKSLSLILEGADSKLQTELEAAFPESTISPAENFLGGLEIAVILKPAKELLESILGFVTQWRGRYEHARVTINGSTIDLVGYGPNDVLKIMKQAGLSPGEKNEPTI